MKRAGAAIAGSVWKWAQYRRTRPPDHCTDATGSRPARLRRSEQRLHDAHAVDSETPTSPNRDESNSAGFHLARLSVGLWGARSGICGPLLSGALAQPASRPASRVPVLSGSTARHQPGTYSHDPAGSRL